jgi:hypothetical protein
MDDEFVKKTCKPGTVDCCRYLIMDANGWGCAKLTSLKAHLDFRVNVLENIRATGDNCDGIANPNCK